MVSSSKRPFIVPAQRFGVGAAHDVVGREDRLTVKLVIVPTAVEFLFNATTYFEPQIGRNGHTTCIQ